jgi:hypothetical protein
MKTEIEETKPLPKSVNIFAGHADPDQAREKIPDRPGFEGSFYDQFVPELLASYDTVGGLNNRDAHNMPSTRAIGEICGGAFAVDVSRFPR